MTEFRIIQKRGKILAIIFAFICISFVARAVEIQIVKHKAFKEYADSQQKSSMPLKSKRGAIYDCRDRLLAYDMETKSYTVNPKYMKNKAKEAAKLSQITGKSKSYWLKKFKKHPGFLYVARRVTPKKQGKFEKINVETFKARVESIRVYPFEDLASEVIGRTDTDNHGVSGLEKQYDDILSGSDGRSIFLRDAYGREIASWEHTIIEPVDGCDIYLTIDLDFQQIVEEELKWMLDSSEALNGSAVFLDLEDGGVVACATVERGDISFGRCRSIVDRNEPGSTAKLIPLAAVFQAGIFEPSDIINVEGGRFKIGRHIVRDDHAYDSLRCDEIGIYSSNIGVSKLGLEAGSDLIYKTLITFGFGEKTGIDFPGEVSSLVYKPEKWTDHFLANVCFGYGIAATGLQIARAYGAVAAGGNLFRPYFVSKMITNDGEDKTINSRKVVRKALDKRTCEKLDRIFRDVVLLGTAQKANSKICLIAGKTGTALRTKREGRGYDRKRSLASFAGYFPADNPRYVGVVMFDEPKTSIYGGVVSAPVFRNISQRFVSLPRNNMLVRNSDENRETRYAYRADKTSKNPAPITATFANIKNNYAYNETLDLLPDFSGKTIRDACRIANSIGLKCTITGSGTVIYQEPNPGTKIENISELHLIGK